MKPLNRTQEVVCKKGPENWQDVYCKDWRLL